MFQSYSTGDGNVSSHGGILALPGEYDWTCASIDPLEFTIETEKGSVQPFLHSLRQKVHILYNGRPYPPELPLPMGDLDLPCNTWCFGPMRAHNPNGTSIGSAIFAQMTAECPYIYNGLPVSPSKLPLPMLASGSHVIRGSLGPPESETQMAAWSFQPFCRQTNRATDRPTDHATRCDAA